VDGSDAVAVTIRLLGPPTIERDGTPVAGPRGHKAWGLLAYLALADAPPSRQRLVSLLFEEADDPRGVLRWNLAELRRALAGVITITGDPVELGLAAGHHIDLQLLASTTRQPDVDVASLGGELLEGMPFADSPCFEAWLAAERHRIAADSRTLVYQSALRLLAAGEPTLAARSAARAVELDPLNADHHTVLVTSLARAGDTNGARQHAARCVDLFRRELGIDPPVEVEQAAQPSRPSRLETAVSPAVVRSYLEAGRAAVSAGAVAPGIGQLRRATVTAVATGDDQLAGNAQLALASALIHGAGGRDAEVATLLHDALAAAERVGEPATAAAACRELGFLAVQLGQRESAEHWLRQAEELCTDDQERAKVLGVRGMSLTDAAAYPAALDTLTASLDHARRVGAQRSEAWTQTMIGRIHVLRGEPALAAIILDQALDMIRSQRWTAFLPWPETFRAEAALAVGDVTTAADLLDHAWVLATETRDHCWIATVAHGLTRLTAIRDPERALHWCKSGLDPHPWYLWPRARLLDAGCDVALLHAPDLARRWATELTKIAARGAMHELTARAHLHRHHLGDPHALDAARTAASDIDNPVLHQLLDSQGPGA
jgi:DNA-binding SARP family transcriptional activator